MESSEQSQQSGTTDEQEAGGEATGIETLAELLAADEAGDENDTSGDDQAESGGSQHKTELTKFNDLAGATDLELDALYKLTISMDEGGEPVTIEQLKDSYKQRTDFDVSVIEFEERRTQQENELLQAKTELQEILQALPANAVKKEVLDKIRAKSEQTRTAEQQKTLEVIPDWQDEDKRTADIAAMAEHLKGYGFPATYLSQVVNHQQLKYIRDNMLRERRIREAIAKVRAGKPGKSSTSKAQKKPPNKGTALDKIKRGQSHDKLAEAFSNVD